MLVWVQHHVFSNNTTLNEITLVSGSEAYRVDPVHVGADAGEDGGLLGEIAAEPGAKADDAVNLPDTSSVLAVQGAARVALVHVTGDMWSVSKFQM